MDWGKDVNMHYFLVRFDSSTKLAIIGVEENHNNNTVNDNNIINNNTNMCHVCHTSQSSMVVII